MKRFQMKSERLLRSIAVTVIVTAFGHWSCSQHLPVGDEHGSALAESSCLDRRAILSPSLEIPGYVRGRHLPKVLVFVHGIWGDGRNTWLNPSGAYWPSLVAYDSAFRDFDIYVYGYDSPRVGRALSIPDLVTDMRTRLVSAGVFQGQRQVVFITHSMGGLIVRGLLLRYRELATQVPAIFFYATPTTGSVLAEWIVAPMRTIQVEGLRPLDVNNFLQTQQNDWLAAGFPTKSYCVFETEDTLAVKVVARESATALCTAPVQGIVGNHSEMVKPRCVSDMQHAILRAAVGDLSSGIGQEPMENRVRSEVQPEKESHPQAIPSPRDHQPEGKVAQRVGGDLGAAGGSPQRVIRPSVHAVAVGLMGQIGFSRADALVSASPSLPDDLSAPEVAVLLDKEQLSARLTLLKILLHHVKVRSLEAGGAAAILAAEDRSSREDMMWALVPYLSSPLSGTMAAQLLGPTRGCSRARSLRPIARLIERPLGAEDVRILLEGITGSCRSDSVKYLFGQ